MNLNVKTHPIVDMNKKSFLVGLGIFVLGIIIGYIIYQFFPVGLEPFLRIIIPIFSGITFIAVATLLVEIVPIIRNYQDKKEKKRLWQDNLIVDDLRNWENKTIFSNIKYDWKKMKIEAIDHKDPDSNDFLLFDADVKVLKKYNAYTSWKNGKNISETLKEKGVEALEEFHRIVDGRLKNLQLKKSLTTAYLKEYYSLPYVCEIIIRAIRGQAIEIILETDNNFLRADGFAIGDIHTGAYCQRFAKGNTEDRNSLKKIIEDLIQDTNVKKQVEIYDRAKNQLKERKHFSEFRSKLEKIFKDSTWLRKIER